MKTPVAFLIYKQYKSFLEYLSQSEKGDLVDLLFEYAETGEEIRVENKAVAMAFNVIKNQIDINVENYQKRVENGKLGGAPSGNCNAKREAENNQKQPQTTINNLKQPQSTENNQNQHKSKTKTITKTTNTNKNISRNTTTTTSKPKSTPSAKEPLAQLSHMGDEGRGTWVPAALPYNETGVPAALSGKEEKKENGFCERTEGFEKNKTARQNLAGCECADEFNGGEEYAAGSADCEDSSGFGYIEENADDESASGEDSGFDYIEESAAEEETDGDEFSLKPPLLTPGVERVVSTEMFDCIYAQGCKMESKILIFVVVKRCLKNGYDITVNHIKRFCSMLECSGSTDNERLAVLKKIASKPAEELVGYFT